MANLTSNAVELASRSFAYVRDYLPEGIPRSVDTLQQVFDQLTAAENEGQAAYQLLLAARRGRFDRPVDYAIYTKLQDELFRAQTQIIATVARIAGPLEPALGAMLPTPTPLPSLTWKSAHAAQRDAAPGVNGLGALGFLPVVAGIIAVLAALGLLYLLSDEIEGMLNDLAVIFVARARAAQQSELLAARKTAFEACIARGGGSSSCLDEVERLVPTPAAAGTEINGPNGGTSSPLRTAMWVGFGGVVLVALGYGVLTVFGSGRGLRGLGYSGVSVRSPGRLPASVGDLDGSKSRYYLEV